MEQANVILQMNEGEVEASSEPNLRKNQEKMVERPKDGKDHEGQTQEIPAPKMEDNKESKIETSKPPLDFSMP